MHVHSLKSTVIHLAEERARLHAGGTDLLGCLRDHVFDTETIVSIRRITSLQGIKQTAEGGIRIGALTTITEVTERPLLKNGYEALVRAAMEVASPQLRNQGTIGGNICQKPRCWHYCGDFHCLRKGGDQCFSVGGENQSNCIFGGDQCYIVHHSDTATELVALDASGRIYGSKGIRTVPVADFHVLPGQNFQRETILKHDEIVTETIFPAVSSDFKSTYYKVRARRSWDFAPAGLALAIRFSGPIVEKARVVFSGVAPVL